MDFCPNCGSIIMPGSTKCSSCGMSKNGFHFNKLKIGIPDKYIKDKMDLWDNYEEFISLIVNKDEIEFTKGDILPYFDNVIDIANENFIKREKKIILKDLDDTLKSDNKFVNDEKRLELKSKYNRDYYKYYDVLKLDNKIDKFNNHLIGKEKDVILKEFDDFLSSRKEYIFKENIINLKSKYNKVYFNFYDDLRLDDEIDKFNNHFIEKEKDTILKEFEEFLSSRKEYIFKEDIISLKSDYFREYCNFYDELKMEDEINKFNIEFIDDKKQDVFDKLPDEYISHSQIEKYQKKMNVPFELDSLIEEHNNDFIERHIIDNDFFDNVDGRSLDKNQRIAVLTDDDNTQIVAGAGTGKTLTIQAKVKYLIEKQGIQPEDILCISFSNSARDDLARKLKRTIDAPVEVRTFHSLGYSILGINGYDREVPKHELADLINLYFKHSISDKPDLIKDVVEFFCYYFNIIFINSDNLKLETIKSRFNALDEYDEYLSEYLQIKDVKRTKEYMGSIKELILANYLFIHNINYEYFKQAIFKDKNYNTYIFNYFNYLFDCEVENIPYDIKLELVNELDDEFACKKLDMYPNFFLPDEDIYIDLISLKPNWKEILEEDAKQKYITDFKEIEELNSSYKTKLLTICDYEDEIDGFLGDVENKLLDNQVTINEVNYKNIFEGLILKSNLPDYNRFITTVVNFINLFKGNAINIDYNGNDISKEMFKTFLNENNEKFTSTIVKRNKFYLNIIKEIYDIYMKDLEDNDLIDFNDMINEAVVELRKGAYIHGYKYVIVDEYQDTSHTRYNLLKEIQNATGAKVVVVGDDWQSIYGFTGCDVNLFSQFDKYFDNPKMVKIDITRRNSQKLIDVVGEFIQKNENQIPKKLKSDKINQLPIKIFEYVSRAEEVLALINILDNISEEKPDAEVLILGRNNNDIYEILCSGIFEITPFKDYTEIEYERKPDLNIEFRTVHKSKGLESDYVVVLNLNNQINGFPNKIDNDPILDFVNNVQDEDIDYPEERRLFYVALTRTKNDVYLFSRSTRPSEFIKEIKNKKGVEILEYAFPNDEIILINTLLKKRFEVIEMDNICPKCNSGTINLIVNNERGTSYFRCSNICGWEGAKYHNSKKDDGTRKITYIKYVEVCPRCNNGLLIVRRNSNDGSIFLGCTSYPECRKTKDITINHEEVNNFIINISNFDKINKTRSGVYYMEEYIPEEKRLDYDRNRVDFSKRLIGYKKDWDDYSVDLFTKDLMKFITELSESEFGEDITKLVLIAIPSSKVDKTNNSVKKSIDIIEEWFDNGELESEFDFTKEIVNCKDLLKRVKDVPTAHKGEGRASCEQHIDSIECGEFDVSDENTVYIILDDITTTGNSMQAGNEILLKKGVESNKIYNIAFGATVRNEDGEI